ncbi:MAG: thioredoxin-dependent thiol peroxidase [Paracoccaceae bacterium]|nr:thioredoxin-dependent thiol peroxidase [Paracoccaceae bacterium]MDG1736774.1 thioredoxin-dependent thiol peroxidase [Paracoccaceae bacterium]MDG2258323.1 thioredoxin-dependent thiol peroxidase [Paracoccaceae bacterium]
MITENAPAPNFTLPRDGGGEVSLSSFSGAPVVLFFYPKDNTPGCTTEAIDFTARVTEFTDLGCKVLGISKDSVKKHDNFRDKHNLGIALLSDADGQVCEDYGVWQEKKMYGKVFMGIVRTTVLIDADGKIKHIWNKVKVKDHAEQVLQAVRDL